ncbi:MAG: insulinase family protein [Firmicutes bacterium]|nr:insulinase family protein [Bacillota bacterium]
MEYIKKEYAAYNVHIIKTDKFKSITIDVNFLRKIKKEEITIRNFLSEILLQSSKNYPTKRLLALKSMELYDSNVRSSNSRIGNFSNLSFNLKFLNDKYTEDGMFDKTLDFFFDILFNPNVENGRFDEKSFKIVNKLIYNEIKSIKDNLTKYSLIKMLEHMGKNEPYSYRGYGYIEDLEKITPQKLYEYYTGILKSDKVNILIIGDVDTDKVLNIIHDKFKINTVKKDIGNAMITHEKVRGRLRKVDDYENIIQSKLNIGFKLKDLSDYELRYVLPIYNEIFGGSPNSKLFQNIREKHSLAYYITSMPNIFDNLLIIYSGINKNSYDKAVDLIKKELNNMKKGKFTDEEINKAKENMLASLETIEDSPARIINMYYARELAGGDEIEERIRKVKQVTKEDIIKVATKLKIDTIYLMHGEE